MYNNMKTYTPVLRVCVYRSAGRGGRPSAGSLQTQAAASEVSDAGEAGDDAAGSSGAHQAAGSSGQGAARAHAVEISARVNIVVCTHASISHITTELVPSFCLHHTQPH